MSGGIFYITELEISNQDYIYAIKYKLIYQVQYYLESRQENESP